MKNKKKRKYSLKFISFIISVIILATALYFSSNRILIDLALETFSSSISSTSYNAISKIVKSGYRYEDLSKICLDSSGQVTMIITNSIKVNEVSSSVATDTYNFLKKQIDKGVEVPLGAFTGVRLFSGFGPKIKMALISVASVKCDILSEFRSAGINQVRHVLYLNIISTVSLVTKTTTKTVSDKINVLVYDNLIVGKVPEVFITSQLLGTGIEK